MAGILTRNDIFRCYPRASRDPEVASAAVLDVAFDVLLYEFHTNSLFDVCGLVFKGGTALRKFDIGHKSRFSFDLDFNTTEAPSDVAAIVGDTLASAPDLGFGMAITERRGHYSVRFESTLFPEGSRSAKIDFSHRHQVLPARQCSFVRTPLHVHYPIRADFTVPVMDLDENIAEKVSRWRTRPLIRDLFDLAMLARSVSDMQRVAAMYVLKSHRDWQAQAPNRRPPTPAGPLAGPLTALDPTAFDMEGLVLPTAPSDTEKRGLVQKWLNQMAPFCERLDSFVNNSDLLLFAADTDGHLGHEAEQLLAALRSEPTESQAVAPARKPTTTTRASPIAIPPRGLCGAPTLDGESCANPAPALGTMCAAGHTRRA